MATPRLVSPPNMPYKNHVFEWLNETWPMQPAAALRTALGWTLCWLQTMPLDAVWYSEEPLCIEIFSCTALPRGGRRDVKRTAAERHSIIIFFQTAIVAARCILTISPPFFGVLFKSA